MPKTFEEFVEAVDNDELQPYQKDMLKMVEAANKANKPIEITLPKHGGKTFGRYNKF